MDDLYIEIIRRRQARARATAELVIVVLALGIVLIADCARAQDGGLVVDGSAVVTTDAGVVLMPSAVCLDETASIRVARELASRRAIEPVLRETPAATPAAVIVGVAVGVAAGVALGAWAGVSACRETALCR
jgi:hypothetical protein